MDNQQNYWDKKITGYSKEKWIDKPSIFAKWAIQFFPKNGKLLELGAGHGQDGNFFATKGYSVISTDFSETALKYNLQKHSLKQISIQKLNLKKVFPFNDNEFNIIYAHLAIHFFDNKITTQIFSEIYRVLKPEGILAVIVNSTKDPEYNTGNKIENDFFELLPGITKRFFSIQSMEKFSYQFKTLIMDHEGKSYKDKVKLIKFIGQKSK
ncbi:MAG: class I SAM-dependent methyltransferase [Candidatus Daviesbacteria bacterium]|nr:class I SAM-dependent methyltransferase [Candidatus Daviesbacteria bacterium]